MRTRLIALTGYGTEADRQRVMAAGFDALTKPADMAELQELIARADAAPGEQWRPEHESNVRPAP